MWSIHRALHVPTGIVACALVTRPSLAAAFNSSAGPGNGNSSVGREGRFRSFLPQELRVRLPGPRRSGLALSMCSALAVAGCAVSHEQLGAATTPGNAGRQGGGEVDVERSEADQPQVHAARPRAFERPVALGARHRTAPRLSPRRRTPKTASAQVLPSVTRPSDAYADQAPWYWQHLDRRPPRTYCQTPGELSCESVSDINPPRATPPVGSTVGKGFSFPGTVYPGVRQ